MPRPLLTCPECGTLGPCHSVAIRQVRDVRFMFVVSVSKVRCPKCKRIRSMRVPGISKNYRYTDRLRDLCVVFACECGLTAASRHYGVPLTTIHDWVVSTRNVRVGGASGRGK